MSYPTTRGIKDNSLIVVGTLPYAANTTYSNVIDLQGVANCSRLLHPLDGKIHAKIALVGTATGANNKNINIRIVDSSDNSSYSNVAVIANPVLRVVDNNNAGFENTSVTISLPPSLKQYVKLAAVGEANGGNSADGTFTLTLLF